MEVPNRFRALRMVELGGALAFGKSKIRNRVGEGAVKNDWRDFVVQKKCKGSTDGQQRHRKSKEITARVQKLRTRIQFDVGRSERFRRCGILWSLWRFLTEIWKARKDIEEEMKNYQSTTDNCREDTEERKEARRIPDGHKEELYMQIESGFGFKELRRKLGDWQEGKMRKEGGNRRMECEIVRHRLMK